MHGITQFAVWIKAPSADVAVVIVTSATLPQYMIDRLHVAIDEWDQVAYLAVKQAAALRADWLRDGSSPQPSAGGYVCHASQLLRSVSHGSFLLDVEMGTDPGMTWLGSVCGHPLRVVELGAIASSTVQMDRQVEAVLSATRCLAKSVLQARGVI
ncbi:MULTISPECIES: transketolase [Pseudomonas]|uniref:Transketolase n=1 Tax=Pseudomonas gessardii TaxID=78544 RepID=A0A7Y1MV32_9PSED|nr:MULTISPECIES: transketolase [Pseudomonas]MBH3421092.1 transketolase [Pseudomonas gessardii]MCF4981571.1 transketolase [Pseudomonas gessardii]MCF4992657.1 transketolase [Pseudomonas gessardii]MCF5087162.1 transketolase [Pseudomonas gessardii]MCF5097751.1 transketolase [Pseudomonas gessardii]